MNLGLHLRRFLAPVLSLACAVGAASAQSAVQLTNTSATNYAYVRVPHDAALTPQQFTLEAWITPQGPGYGQTGNSLGTVVLGKLREGASGTYLGSWALGWTPVTNQVYVVVVHTFATQGVFLFSNGAVPIGTSAHIAATFDGTTIRLYLDGQLDASAAFPYSGVYYGTEDVLIGAANLANPYERRFDGIVDDVRIWSYARDQRRIALQKQCRLTGAEPGLVAYYTFDASNAVDDTGHGHTGTLAGPAYAWVGEPVAIGSCVSPAVAYCTSGTTTNGCLATLSSSGVASASQSSGFVLSASNIEGQKSGLIFYGINGPVASPWMGGTSFLCVKSPTQRTDTSSSGGTANACNGSFSFDFLAYVASHPGVLGTPFGGGEVVNAQAWFRDPPAPGTTNLSNALCFLMAP